RLLPDLRERYPDLPPLTINGAFASSLFFEGLARLSQALASQAPLLMFVDDMQWTDAATLDAFQYLARYWTEHATPAMLLQELLERGLLVPRLIAGSGWVFEPQPSILEATLPDTMLPWDVREMIQQRLTRLSSPARDLLAAGAVLGHDFTFEELCQVARLAP